MEWRGVRMRAWQAYGAQAWWRCGERGCVTLMPKDLFLLANLCYAAFVAAHREYCVTWWQRGCEGGVSVFDQ